MEKLSELMDGEMDSREASVCLKRLKEEPKLREDWDLYHLVGDAIRRETGLAIDLRKSVSARLAQEPTVMAPRFTAPRRTFTRYAMSAAAGLAGIAVVGWVAYHDGQLAPAKGPVATSAPAPSVAQNVPLAESPTGMVLAQDAEVEDYLMSHQAVSSFTTMHGALPYVRAAAAGAGRD